MTSTRPATRSLYNILREERDRGFDDTAVIGGLDGFLVRHASDLESYLGGIASYASLTTEERSEWSRQTVQRMREDTSVSDRPESAVPRHGASPRPKPKGQSRKRPPPDRSLKLSDDVTLMKGVWRKMQPRLESIGVNRVGDLVYQFPNRHSDYTRIRKVAQLSPGEDQTAILTVWEASQTMLGRQKSTQAVLGDETGNVRAVWFNNPWLASRLKQGSRVSISGKVNVFRGSLVFQGPECEVLDEDDDLLHTGRLVPVYSTTQGLSQRVLRTLVKRALDECIGQIGRVPSTGGAAPRGTDRTS